MKFKTEVFTTVSGRHKAIKELAKQVSKELNTSVTPRMLSGLLGYYVQNDHGTYEIGSYVTDIDYRLKCGQKIYIETNIQLNK